MLFVTLGKRTKIGSSDNLHSHIMHIYCSTVQYSTEVKTKQ